MTQTNTIELPYAIPSKVTSAGFEGEVENRGDMSEPSKHTIRPDSKVQVTLQAHVTVKDNVASVSWKFVYNRSEFEIDTAGAGLALTPATKLYITDVIKDRIGALSKGELWATRGSKVGRGIECTMIVNRNGLVEERLFLEKTELSPVKTMLTGRSQSCLHPSEAQFGSSNWPSAPKRKAR